MDSSPSIEPNGDEVARNSLLAYGVGMKLDYETPRHVKLIASKLEALERRDIRRLMIFMPPRHGKSTLANELFPSWYMGRNPGQNVITTSYSQEVASDFGRKVRNLVDDDRYERIFRGVQLMDDSAAAHRFTMNTGGSYYAVGAGGPLTSRGADLIIIDDIHKNKAEAKSEAIGKGIKEWFGPVLYTRLAKNGIVVLIQTRWTQDDLPGHILDSQGADWTVLSLPAIDEAGEALWPERYPISTLLEIKRTLGTQDFTALYQQTPTPDEGEVVKRSWWKYYRELPKEMDVSIQSWDLTFKDTEQSDFVVGTVWGRKGADKYLLDMVRKRMSFTQTQVDFKALSTKWPRAMGKLVEEAANGAALIDTLRRSVPGIIPIRPRGSKLIRAQAVSPQVEAGNVWLPDPALCPWVQEFIEEWAMFPNGRHDDIVDSTTQALSRLAEMPITNFSPLSLTGTSKWVK